MQQSFRHLILVSFLILLACDNEEPTKIPTTGGDGTRKLTIPSEGFESPLSYEGMSLVWQDEFEGSALDTENWVHESGTGANGWGNNELQYYQAQNTSLVEGNLVIEAKKETIATSEYTSSRIITLGRQSFKYGRIDVRAVLPEGQGIWPAVWMLGTNFPEVGWPRCGEIDIMEMVGGGGKENTVHGTVHWYTASGNANYGGEKTLPDGDLNTKYHVFSIIWDESKITWLVDGQQYHVIDTTPAELDEFREEFFFIINLAVGGNWPGPPNGSTRFPQWLIVDYIRVFQTI